MSKNDNQIRDYQKKVETKRVAMGHRPRLANKTNLMLLVPDGTKINLNTIRTIEDFVDIVAGMEVLKFGIDRANKLLCTNQKVSFGAYTFDEWVHDIKGKISLIEWDAEDKQLKVMEAKLTELLSDDAKTGDELDGIGKLLD